MKRHLISLLVAASALVPVASALAADLDTLPPPPVNNLRPAAYDWSGGYAGVFIGGICLDSTITDNTNGNQFINAGCGIKGGALAGWNFQVDNMVFGVEGSAEKMTQLVEAPIVSGDFNFTYDYIGRANARVGWALDDNLFFLMGGGAYGAGHHVDNPNAGPAVDMTFGQWGVSVGGGVEHAFTDRFHMRADYLYTHWLSADYGSPCGTCSLKDEGGEHEVRLGAIWQF